MKKYIISLFIVFFTCFCMPYCFASSSSSQSIKHLAVFIKFSNSSVEHSIDDPECILNAEKIFNSDEFFDMNTVTGVVKVPSFKKYYEMQSYGSLSITTKIFPQVNGKVLSYQDSHPIEYYLRYSDSNPIGYTNESESLKRETELINNAVGFVSNHVTTSGISPNEIDIDNDNVVDAISFFVEGKESSVISWRDLLWSHKLDNDGITNTILGKRIKPYTLIYVTDYTQSASVFSLNRGTYGTIIHEFGHTLGFMDLYRYGFSANRPVGFYDIMGNNIGSNPQDFLSYFTSEYRNNTNWHAPLPIINKTTKNITLYKPQFIDKNEKRAIKIQPNSNSKEYFIVEYHDKKDTYDSYSADLSGIIVYRVNDNNKYLGNASGGTDGIGDHIYVFRPNESILGEGKGDLSKATLNTHRPILGKDFLSSNQKFDSDSIYYSDGSNSGIILQVVSQTDSSVTFNIQFSNFDGDGTQSNPYLIYNKESFLNLMKLDTKNKYYKLMNDLDFANISYPQINFMGILDGNNKTLKNIHSKGSGVFMNVGNCDVNCVIQNLNIENINVEPSNGDYLGGFACTVEDATLRNIHLISGSVKNTSSKLNSLSSTGGFAGNVYSTTFIDNCSSSVNVYSESNVGGFIGINMNAVIQNSYANGLVGGISNVGGFIGLQCISDSTYNTPQNAYYDYTRSKVINPVGGYANFLHNLGTLPANSLGNGIVGVSVLENIVLNVGDEKVCSIVTTPSTPVNYSNKVSDSTIIKCNNNKVQGLKHGSAKLYTDLIIGTQIMRMETNVVVNPSIQTPDTQVPSKPFPFVDVSKDKWYYNSVKFVYDRNIILGSTSTLFMPNNNLTRGMLVTILWRMEGSPNVYSEKIFPDVKPDQYYFSAVKWAYISKVVSGHDDGTFKPNAYITRQQLAVMIHNYAKYINKTGKVATGISNFKDYKNVSSYAKDSVGWAVSNKIISGKENGTRLDPHGYATRAEASAIIQNYLSYVFSRY